LRPRRVEIVGDHCDITVVRRRTETALASGVRGRQIKIVPQIEGHTVRGRRTNRGGLKAVVEGLRQVGPVESSCLLTFLFVYGILHLLIRLRGPFRARKMADYANGAAEQLWVPCG